MRRNNRRKMNIPLTRNFSDVEASIKRVSEARKNLKRKNSLSKVESYQGYWNIDFNLYNYEDIDFNATKEAVLDNMNNKHLKPMQKDFAEAGLKLKNFNYYSPHEYNYKGDSIDLNISVSDREKLKKYIESHRSEIQKNLSSNKSYDGYMTTTSSDVDSVIEKIDKNFDVDPMIVSYIQKKHKLDQYDDFYDLIVYDDPEDEEANK